MWLRGGDLGSRYDGTALQYSAAAGHDMAQQLLHGAQRYEWGHGDTAPLRATTRHSARSVGEQCT